MKWIELDKLPEEIIAAIETDYYTDSNDKPANYSASNLIAPIQQTELKRRYKGSGKLKEVDPLDGYNAWIGSVIHNAIETAWKSSMESIVEERFYKNFTVNGKTYVISGKVDCLAGDTIKDWKTCRVYKVVKGDVEDWEKQQNIYANLAEHNGYKINHLEIYPILLDLKKHEQKFKKDLPKKPIVRFDLRRWSNEESQAYIEERIKLLEKAKRLSDAELFQQIPCTRKEQWSEYKDTSVFKIGAERATKVLYNKEEAEEWLTNHKSFTRETHEIRDRYKPRIRCIDYCDANKVCQQYKIENTVMEIK